MKKYEFANEKKNIIKHNLVPKMLIEIIKLKKPNDFESAEISVWSDIFEEKIIKGHHFIFKIINDEDFEEIEDFSLIRSILKRASKWYQAKIAMGEVELKRYNHNEIIEDDNFKIVKSDQPNWWLVAHKESSIIIEFEHGNFNSSQKVSELTPISDFMKIAKILREVSEWLAINHPEKLHL